MKLNDWPQLLTKKLREFITRDGGSRRVFHCLLQLTPHPVSERKRQMLTTTRSWFTAFTLAAMAVFVTGCAGETETNQVANNETHEDHDHDEHDHSGWWCVEHGVPEGECSRCDASLVASFKEKGDWCEEHDLPTSQCFKCDPTRAEPFIARYEAKYGEKPPAPTE
jgi:hypothetical protein